MLSGATANLAGRGVLWSSTRAEVFSNAINATLYFQVGPTGSLGAGDFAALVDLTDFAGLAALAAARAARRFYFRRRWRGASDRDLEIQFAARSAPHE